MSGSRRRSKQQRKRSAPPPETLVEGFWRVVPEAPEPEPVVPAPDPTALLRSLGSPPLAGQGAAAEHELAKVVLRASGLATALAAAAGLLAADDEDGVNRV